MLVVLTWSTQTAVKIRVVKVHLSWKSIEFKIRDYHKNANNLGNLMVILSKEVE